MVMVRDKRKSVQSGWCACDSLWKVPTIGHLGEGHRGKVAESSNAPP